MECIILYYECVFHFYIFLYLFIYILLVDSVILFLFDFFFGSTLYSCILILKDTFEENHGYISNFQLKKKKKNEFRLTTQHF